MAREFSIHDKYFNSTINQKNLKSVLEIIPDLSNDEIESIVNLNVSESVEFDSGKIIVIRTM